jgi:hypothetical protein
VVPVREVDRLRRAEAPADADVIVQDVEAVVALDREGRHGFRRLRPGDVRGERRGLAAFGADALRQRLGPVQAAVDKDHLGALAGEQDGRSGAVADALRLRRRARDDGDLAAQATHASLLPIGGDHHRPFGRSCVPSAAAGSR